MRLPQSPPKTSLTDSISASADDFIKAFQLTIKAPKFANPHIHWDQLRRLPAPTGLAHEMWWKIIKFTRYSKMLNIPLKDKGGKLFGFLLPDAAHQQLHEIDRKVGGMIAVPQQVVNQQTRDQYLISSLMNEAITSSQLEGAVTTRAVAKEMIRTGRSPTDKSERMILNNYQTMRRIVELKAEPLTQQLVFDLHRMVTDGTLDENAAAGRFRTSAEKIMVTDETGEVFHDPPGAEQLPARMEAMCAFANDQDCGYYLHPVVRAILLHFWLAYDHPFIDGNGRTARALFYWSMLHNGYWLFEFVSISDIILKSPKAYYLSFLHTETDEGDATYFIVHQLDVIVKGIQSLYSYIAKKTQENSESEKLLRDWALDLNHRQLSLISHALRHPNTYFTVEWHQNSHGTVYETARTDLLGLVKKRLFLKTKRGKTMIFSASPDLASLIRKGRADNATRAMLLSS